MKWFKENNVQNISIRELSEEIKKDTGTVQLPVFQRDAVWNEDRVELLWDSIIRSFPIGSLMFARASDYDDGKIPVKYSQGNKDGDPSYTIEINKGNNKVEFVIIDGQQRSNAIALAFRKWTPGDYARLWIDIGNRKTDSFDENFLYRVYLCTASKPWGKSASYPQIRRALHALYSDEGKDIDENYYEDLNKRDPDLLGKTWPARALAPVPFADLIKWDGKGDWKDLIPGVIPEKIRKEMYHINIDIKNISDIVEKIKNFKVPVYLIEGLTDIEDLGTAFQRINRMGVQMSDEDLFFSGLKTVWPEAHDLVWEVYSDIETGKFMSPSRIVHNVVRLAASKTQPGGRHDVLDLNLKEFKKLIKPEEDTGAHETELLKYMKSYLEKGKDGISRYHYLIKTARKFLQYDDTNNPDGLPVTLLASLHRRVWHTLTGWIDRFTVIDPDDESQIETRNEMIRYAIFDSIYIKGNYAGYMSLPFEIACFSETENFPGHWIYCEMIKRNFFGPEFSLYTPEKYKEMLYDKDGFPHKTVLKNDSAILHWNQRLYIAKWFKRYDPTLYRGKEDLPYDIDHIIAGNHFNMQGIRGTHSSFWKMIRDRGMVNSIGNYRLWPKSLNRSDQDDDILKKYVLGDKDKMIPEVDEKSGTVPYLRKKPYNCKTVEDVRKASCVSENDLDKWKTAANIGDTRNWNKPRRINAYITAVQNRNIELYTNLYAGIKMSVWLQEIKDDLKLYSAQEKETKREIIHLPETEEDLIEMEKDLQIDDTLSSLDFDKIQKNMERICLNEQSMKICCRILGESIRECHSQGPDKWGITLYHKFLFLNLGSVAVLSLKNDTIGFALSEPLVEKYSSIHEQRGYNIISSAWCNYSPSLETFDEVWGKIKIKHFQFIEKAAMKFTKLREPSKKAHSNKLIQYIENQIDEKLPRPDYT